MLIYERSTKSFLYSSIKSIKELERTLDKLNTMSGIGFAYSVIKDKLKLTKDQPMITGHEWLPKGKFVLESHYNNGKTEIAVIDYIL